MEEAAYNHCLEDAATRACTTVAQAVATMTATTVVFVTPAPPAECGAFLTEQAALIMAPPKDPTTLDHQLVLDIIQSMPNRDPNTFQFILAVNFAYLIVQMILTDKMDDHRYRLYIHTHISKWLLFLFLFFSLNLFSLIQLLYYLGCCCLLFHFILIYKQLKTLQWSFVT